MDWNDLRFLIAVAEKGTLKAAADHLGVNHTTAWRRIQALEKDVGCQLLVGDRRGYHLTDEGESVLEHARLMSAHVDAIKLQTSSKTIEIKGLIRITAPGTIAWQQLPILIAEFRQIYPEVEFEILEESAALNLGKREADIALRASPTPPDDVIAKKIGIVPWAIYANESLISKQDMTLDDIKCQPIIDYSGFHNSASNWFQKQMAASYKPITCNNILAAYNSALNGLGFALLPMDQSYELVKAFQLPEEYNSAFWLLAHPEMRNAARIKAFWDFLLAKVNDENGIFGGNRE